MILFTHIYLMYKPKKISFKANFRTRSKAFPSTESCKLQETGLLVLDLQVSIPKRLWEKLVLMTDETVHFCILSRLVVAGMSK